MRLFLAIDLPAAARDAVALATASSRAEFAALVRWVEPERLHLTVKFLGEQPESLVERLQDAMRARVSASATLDLRIVGTGAFPSVRQPRVLWCGVAANPGLERLYQEVEQAAADVGVPGETRKFHPHLTLGRVRAPLAADDAGRLASMLRAVDVNEHFTVETIDLMRSELSAQGARYERLWSVATAAPDAPTGLR
jgi:2'-5' RNA ligase